MSFEEDIELKNLVAQTLENKGILPKIRAELRANVFLALEENPTTKETLLKNDDLSSFVKFPIGTLILNLIREFLEFFELEFTLSVFDPETKYGKDYNGITKEKMMKELKLTECKKNPLLCEVIERIINSNDLKNIGSEKSLGDFSHGDISGSGDSGNLPSPFGLNSTFVKKKSEGDSAPISPIGKDDKDESIKEELISNNVSESDTLSVDKLNTCSSPKVEKIEEVVSNSSPKSRVNSPKVGPPDPVEIDLLTFTPVRPVEKVKQSSNSEANTADKKQSQKSMSPLGDLPPLTGKTDERGDKMNKIKAIIDKWPGFDNDDESSVGSKSSKEQLQDEKSMPLKSDRSDNSQKSDKTESPDDFEEDFSDLMNGHTPSDGQLTVDETVSKIGSGADYLESL